MIIASIRPARLNLRARCPGLLAVTKSPLTGDDRREAKPIIRVAIKGQELDWLSTRTARRS